MRKLRTLPEALADAAAGDQGYTFVSAGIETRRSYAEMAEVSRRIACALADAGLKRGDVVGVVVGEAEPFLAVLFGASLMGLIPASLYPPPTAAALASYVDLTADALRAARARALVTTGALGARFERIRSTCLDLDLVLTVEQLTASQGPQQTRALRAIDEPALDDIAFVQFTSGSTSTPKGVALSHRNLCSNIDAISGPNGLATTAADSAVSWLPLYHDMGLVGMALGALYSARPAVFLSPQAFVKRPAEWLRAISRHRATVSFAPNFAYDLCVRRVRDRDLDGLDLSCWRVAGCGAEPIHAPTLAAFAARFAAVGFRETSFLPSYGLAEHVLAATFPPRERPLRVDEVRSPDTHASTLLVSCGFPLPDHRIRIVDAEGREVGKRQVGEITLSGPSVMLGYYNDEDLTRETIRDGWLWTGDLGYISEGELFVCGRVKDLIIVNGRKYHPQDLEWGVDGLSGVRRGRVVAFGAGQTGGPDRVVIVMEPNGTVKPEVLTDRVRRRIAELHGVYVDDVVLVPGGTVARTTSGKVQRAATKARYENGELAAARGACPDCPDVSAI